MLNSYYTSSTGLITMQRGMEVVANNVANSSTVGYKATDASFADLVYNNIHAPEEADSLLQRGAGSRLHKVDTVHAAGALRPTGLAFDFALTDDRSFFAIQSDDGVYYTRGGSFHLSVEGDTSYLVNAAGDYVLGAGGARIPVGSEEDALAIGTYTFANTDGLLPRGETGFIPTELSGEAQATDAEVKRGYLEESTVQLSDEMTTMIQIQRAFQLNSRMVQISDELMQTLNSMR